MNKIVKYIVTGIAIVIMFFAITLILGEENPEMEYSMEMFWWIKFSAGCTVYAMGKIVFTFFPVECKDEENKIM